VAGEGEEVVDVAAEALRKLTRPRQPDQRDARFGQGHAQRAQRRHRAQHVAQLQRAKHHDVARVDPLEQGHPAHRQNVPA
jgi:hypothetical protein